MARSRRRSAVAELRVHAQKSGLPEVEEVDFFQRTMLDPMFPTSQGIWVARSPIGGPEAALGRDLTEAKATLSKMAGSGNWPFSVPRRPTTLEIFEAEEAARKLEEKRRIEAEKKDFARRTRRRN